MSRCEVHMTDQEMATTSCLRTLRRREAGEHTLTVGECIWIWATEYALTPHELEQLNSDCHVYAAMIHDAH